MWSLLFCSVWRRDKVNVKREAGEVIAVKRNYLKLGMMWEKRKCG